MGAQEAVAAAADRSFNSITMDGDTSTNDCVLALANGASEVTIDSAEGRQALLAVIASFYGVFHGPVGLKAIAQRVHLHAVTLANALLFFVLGFAGLRIAARSTNKFLGYAAVGMTAWIVVQAMINIFVVMRLLPVVGVPLPFLSQGGSALLANLIAVGVLLSAARQEPGAARLLASGPKARQPRLISVIDAPRGRN